MDPYTALQQDRPEWFVNPPGGITIDMDPAAVARAGGVLFQDSRRAVLVDAVHFPDGKPGTYLRTMSMSRQPGAAVLPLLPDLRVVLTEHFRHATRTWHLEAPRGFGTGALTGAETATKELGEEIGARPESLIPLGQMHPDTGALGDTVALFAARVTSTGALETSEGIRRLVVVPFHRAEAMARDDEITDGLTLALLYRARLSGVAL